MSKMILQVRDVVREYQLPRHHSFQSRGRCAFSTVSMSRSKQGKALVS